MGPNLERGKAFLFGRMRLPLSAFYFRNARKMRYPATPDYSVKPPKIRGIYAGFESGSSVYLCVVCY